MTTDIHCKDLKHPFLNDPGVSQRQRVMEDLLSGAAQIDGRSMADLLDHFRQLARHINFYDTDGSVKDWQPFFNSSLPFSLAGIIRHQRSDAAGTFQSYRQRFNKKPAPAGLQLLITWFYNKITLPLNTWQQQFRESSLPVETALSCLIGSKLRGKNKEFIAISNTAASQYGIRIPDFRSLLENDIWDLDTADLYTYAAPGNSIDPQQQLTELYNRIADLLPAFLNVIAQLSDPASGSMEASFFPLQQELQEKHSPHLAIVFSFLKLFRYLQQDLNSFTRKHLDFFYKQVLRIQPRKATPDKVHVVFDVQDQLDQYLLRKGLLLKGGKDSNKAEMLFALDDEIVVNKAQVADTRTLFLNSNIAAGDVYLEGVYMAPDARKADGVDKDFKTDPASWPTLGSRYSKYTDPENKFVKPYPNARIGFLLGSPALLLREGKRTIDIVLQCDLSGNLCGALMPAVSRKSPCCDGTSTNGGTNQEKTEAISYYNDPSLCGDVNSMLGKRWYYINRELIAAAAQKGVGKTILEILNGFLSKEKRICYCPSKELLYETTVFDRTANQKGFEDLLTDAQRLIISDFFKPRCALDVVFSGEKSWIRPSILGVSLDCASGSQVQLRIHAELDAGQEAITYYNAENLKEDFRSSQPMAKIELDDKIKLTVAPNGSEEEESCCERPAGQDPQLLSLYHFLRNLVVHQADIDVKVCGVKNLVVQNDENVENVNNLMRPFGVRPKVGSSFYIGSKEIFSKNWQQIWINVAWKDKPANLDEHYKFYNYYAFEDGKKVKDAPLAERFKVHSAVLEQGTWKENGVLRLFHDPKNFPDSPCGHKVPGDGEDTYYYIRTDFPDSAYQSATPNLTETAPLTVATRSGFLRMTLEGISFQHDYYPFVLARHMMALANHTDPVTMAKVAQHLGDAKEQINAILNRVSSLINESQLITTHITTILGLLTNDTFPSPVSTTLDGIRRLNDALRQELTAVFNALSGAPNVPLAQAHLATARSYADAIRDKIGSSGNPNTLIGESEHIADHIANIHKWLDNDDDGDPATIETSKDGILQLATSLKEHLLEIEKLLKIDPELQGLPSEPYTPTIKTLSLDYIAHADTKDIDLVHLYPYAGTSKDEELEAQPALFPTYCDEGSLFIGFKNLEPGNNLNLLFQLAEATADSESEREELGWSYLDNNQWKPLRKGFEVLEDATDGLTVSGIVKLALPENMTNENTILPKGLHWIKVAIPLSSRSVSETIGIHTQAIRATFTNDAANDALRLATPLPAGSVARLLEADTSVKQVVQPYDSFEGRVPEAEGQFYVRTSETLRHKGRAIRKFDYERLALEAFPQLYKAKCINHTFALNAHRYSNDFTIAPGYVVLAVIPDLNQLKASRQFEPRVPVSLLEKVENYLRQRTSPFVRLRVMNPVYEKVNFCMKVQLLPGKDENYYRELLKEDLREFLAPWAIGVYDKLSFGQCINRSDIIRFLEQLDYIDFVADLQMWHEADTSGSRQLIEVCPVTARSILIAGDIDVCIPLRDCPEWDEENPCEQEAVIIRTDPRDPVRPR